MFASLCNMWPMRLILMVLVLCLPGYESNDPTNSIITYKQYSMIIDAATNESKIYLYQFNFTWPNTLRVGLVLDFTFSPGLRSYTEDPVKAIPNIDNLVIIAGTKIPVKYRSRTPLALIATGLRNVTQESVDKLLEAVKIYLITKKGQYRISEDCATQMSGRGKFFSWMSANVLLNRFHTRGGQTVSSLDLGPKACRVAFAPKNFSKLHDWQQKRVVNWTIFNNEYRVFGSRDIGLGLYEARVKMLKPGTANVYTLACADSSVNVTWNYEGKSYTVVGASEKVNMTNCVNTVKSVIERYNRSASLYGTEVYAKSLFYNVLSDSKLNRLKDTSNLRFSLEQIHTRAADVCKNPDLSLPFLCSDLVYVEYLLKEMYGLENNSEINFVDKVMGVQPLWTLGAAFFNFQRQIDMIP